MLKVITLRRLQDLQELSVPMHHPQPQVLRGHQLAKNRIYQGTEQAGASSYFLERFLSQQLVKCGTKSPGNPTRSLRRCFVGTILQHKWESSNHGEFFEIGLIKVFAGHNLGSRSSPVFVRLPDTSHCPVPLSPRPSQSYKKAYPQVL